MVRPKGSICPRIGYFARSIQVASGVYGPGSRSSVSPTRFFRTAEIAIVASPLTGEHRNQVSRISVTDHRVVGGRHPFVYSNDTTGLNNILDVSILLPDSYRAVGSPCETFEIRTNIEVS